MVEDDTVMPFGKHKGKKIGEIPADYLLWVGDNFEPTNQFRKDLLVYIAKNRNALEKEQDETRRTN